MTDAVHLARQAQDNFLSRSRARAQADQPEEQQGYQLGIYRGYSPSLGYDVVELDGRRVPAEIRTNGAIALGATVPVIDTGSVAAVDALDFVPFPEPEVPPRIPAGPTGNIKCLFADPSSGTQDWFVGGDATAREIFTTPVNKIIRRATIHNIGSGPDDWIVQFGYYEELGGDPEFFIETIKQIYGPDTGDSSLNWEREWTDRELLQLSSGTRSVRIAQFVGAAPFFIGTDVGLYPVSGEWVYNGDHAYVQDATAQSQIAPGTLSGSLPGGVSSQPARANTATQQIVTNYDNSTDNSGIDIAALVGSTYVSNTFGAFTSDPIFAQTMGVNGQTLGRHDWSSTSQTDPFEWGGLKWNSTTQPFIITRENAVVNAPNPASAYSAEQFINGLRTGLIGGGPFNTANFTSVQVEQGAGPSLLIESLQNNLTTHSVNWEAPISGSGAGSFPLCSYLANDYFEDNKETAQDSFSEYKKERKINQDMYLLNSISPLDEDLRLVYRRVVETHTLQLVDSFEPLDISINDFEIAAYVFDSDGNSKQISPLLNSTTPDDFVNNYFPDRYLSTRGVSDEQFTSLGNVNDTILGSFDSPKIVRVYSEYNNFNDDSNWPQDRDDLLYDDEIDIVNLETWIYSEGTGLMVKGDETPVQVVGIGRPQNTPGLRVWASAFYDEA